MNERVIKYLTSQAAQTSTWRGLILILTAFGAAITPEQETAIVLVGLFIAGAVGAAFPDAVVKNTEKSNEEKLQ